MKSIYLIAAFFLLVVLPGCKQAEEPMLEVPDCGESICVRAYRMNKQYFNDYEAQPVYYQLSDGYGYALWQNELGDTTQSFTIRVGNFQRPVLNGPGLFRFDQYETAYFSAQIMRDSLVRYTGYSGFIIVDSVSEHYFAGEFELDAQVDTLNNFLKFKGKFEFQK
jgi:hypothetical protein